MFQRGALLLASAPVVLGQDPSSRHGHKSSRDWLSREQVGPAVAAESLVAEDALPREFDYRNINGQSLVTSDWNQHIPQYCGACWIHGTLSALNDRIKVMRRGQYPDVRLGRQSILNCVPDKDGDGTYPGCDGGDAPMIHKYMHENKVPDETCMPYQAMNMGCTADTVCRNCGTGDKGCWAVPKFIGYGVSSYGSVSGEVAMMKEIFARGPIVCSFATDGPFMWHYSENVVQHEGVYVWPEKKNASEVDHDMEVVGWGETPSGIKFWVIRNSWGTYWGEAGWLKLERGVNSLLSEADCAWAIPTWDGLDEAVADRTLGGYTIGQQPEVVYEQTPYEMPGFALQAAATPEESAELSIAALGSFVAGITATLVVLRVSQRRQIEQPQSLLG